MSGFRENSSAIMDSSTVKDKSIKLGELQPCKHFGFIIKNILRLPKYLCLF